MSRLFLIIFLCIGPLVFGKPKKGRFYSYHNTFDIDFISLLFNQADSLGQTFKQNFDFYQIYYTQEERILFFFDGFNFVYEWKNGTLVEISKEQFHGFNYSSFKFERKNNIYTYGGNGFWTFSSDIKRFDEHDGLWKPLPIDGEKPYFEGGKPLFCFYANNKLYAYFHSYSPYDRYRFPIEINKDRLYIFDFDQSKWTSSSFFDEILPLRRQLMIETRQFFNIYHEGYLSFLIDKEKLTYYSFPRDMRDFGIFEDVSEQKYNIAIIQDSVLLYSKPPQSSLIKVYDFNSIAEGIDLSLFQVKTFKSSTVDNRILVGLGLLLLFLALVNVWRLIRLIKIFPYPKLVHFINQEIDQDILDSCLSPENVSNNNKSKRSEIIQEVNNKYQAIINIQRLKSLDDKRIYRYKMVLTVSKLSQWILLNLIIPNLGIEN
ncbi:MAG: hypothetical protein RLZZ248_1008 [Bacteroidota bacterium]|jgi:hypothetical protein